MHDGLKVLPEEVVLPYLKFVTHILKWWTIHPLGSADISIFSSEIRNFVISRNTNIDCTLIHNSLIVLNFESSKVALVIMVTIWMMSGTLTTLGLLKIKVFWNKGCDILISVHDVTDKTFSGESNHVTYVVMWPKLGTSSISVKKVIITSIL